MEDIKKEFIEALIRYKDETDPDIDACDKFFRWVLQRIKEERVKARIEELNFLAKDINKVVGKFDIEKLLYVRSVMLKYDLERLKV